MLFHLPSIFTQLSDPKSDDSGCASVSAAGASELSVDGEAVGGFEAFVPLAILLESNTLRSLAVLSRTATTLGLFKKSRDALALRIARIAKSTSCHPGDKCAERSVSKSATAEGRGAGGGGIAAGGGGAPVGGGPGGAPGGPAPAPA